MYIQRIPDGDGVLQPVLIIEKRERRIDNIDVIMERARDSEATASRQEEEVFRIILRTVPHVTNYFTEQELRAFLLSPP